MKRIAVILFSILYLIPAVGFSLDLHKCGKSTKVLSIIPAQEKKCPCRSCKPIGCCKDFHVSMKIVDAQMSSKCIHVSHTVDFKQLPIYLLITIGQPSKQIGGIDFSTYHAPPFKNKQPVYLANSIFRI